MNPANVDKSVYLGCPSAAWAFGQDRRMGFIQQYADLEGKRVLDVGCGLGMYVRHFREFSDDVYGVDIDAEKVAEASACFPNIQVSPAERLPFANDFFDVVLSHEVLEHVDDDRQSVAEALRVLRPGGKLVIFVPNRLYPFETHGCFWRGKHHFGNIPLVNWLPDPVRRQLCPHVRAYTRRSLRRLWQGLPCRVVVHIQIYPGYDKMVARHRTVGSMLRSLTYALERTPLRAFGLSHFAVLEKTPRM
jgi:SAM-dependent methyltransferase